MTTPGSSPGPADHPASSRHEASPPLVQPPLQERSRRTLQKLLSAGLDLLESEGPEALTVGAITRRARVSVGSFYARFQGKDDLLRFLGESALEESLESWDGRSDPSDTTPDEPAAAEAIEFAVDSLLTLFLEGSGRTLALLDGVQDPPPSRRRRLEVRVAGGVAELTGLDPVRAGLRVRALVGLLHDAARRALLGDLGEVEYGFLPGRETLREEGIALLLKGRVRDVSGRRPGEVLSAPPLEPSPLRELEPPMDVAPEEDANTKGDPGEPSPEADQLPEPDPFDVWG